MLPTLPFPDRALDPEAFRFLIHCHGARVKWFRAHSCTCRFPGDGEFVRSCPFIVSGLCDGNFLYQEQIQEENGVRVYPQLYFERAKKVIEDSQLGLVQVGDFMAYSMPDELPLERGDKVVILDSELKASETVKRGSGPNDALIQKYPFALEEVVWREGEQLRRAVVGVDCLLLPSGSEIPLSSDYVTWTPGGDGPPPGENYSVIYRYRPTAWVSGTSFMPSRPSELFRPANGSCYGLPIRALLTLKHPMEN